MSRLKNMSLVTPCPDCPFRTDVARFLGPGRYADIAEQILDRGESFSCHKTVDYSRSNKGRLHEKTCACAGAMIFMTHCERPNQLMQVMERLGAFDPSRLNMDAPVYQTRAHFETGATA
jgi:hypothetical protein